MPLNTSRMPTRQSGEVCLFDFKNGTVALGIFQDAFRFLDIRVGGELAAYSALLIIVSGGDFCSEVFGNLFFICL